MPKFIKIDCYEIDDIKDDVLEKEKRRTFSNIIAIDSILDIGPVQHRRTGETFTGINTKNIRGQFLTPLTIEQLWNILREL